MGISYAKSLESLKKDSYLHWFVPLRKLQSDMPQTIHRYPERRADNIAHFRSIDFSHPNFKTSGLFQELIEGHYFLLESSDANSRYVEMNRTTDYLLNNLKENHTLLNEMSKKMFAYFEKRSLFKAAAYLSDKLLNDVDCACELDESLEKKMQKYGALKIGATAPDIQLNATRKLSDLNQNMLLVFGSSQCPHFVPKSCPRFRAIVQKSDFK